MSRRVLIFDTSVLCCWLAVPGKDEAGPIEDRWNQARIQELVDQECDKQSTFVLPLASLIETGNHIAQAPRDRYGGDRDRHELATRLADYLRKAADSDTPWAAFTDQSLLWEAEHLKKLAAEWPALAASGFSIGDATIKDVAEHYARAGYEVEILTGDAGLKAYQPTKPAQVPRRRQ